MNFKTKYDRKPDEGEDISSNSKTETSGYIPAQVQIERLLQSGQNLTNYRKEQYDFASDTLDDDTVSVPSRLPSFDLADASQLAMQVEQRLADQEAVIAAENAAKKIGPPAGVEEVTP